MAPQQTTEIFFFFFKSVTFTHILLIGRKENLHHDIWWEPFPLINIIQIVLCKVLIGVNISIPLSSFTDEMYSFYALPGNHRGKQKGEAHEEALLRAENSTLFPFKLSTHLEDITINCSSRMRKLMLREVRSLAQDHTEEWKETKIQLQVCPIPGLALFLLIGCFLAAISLSQEPTQKTSTSPEVSWPRTVNCKVSPSTFPLAFPWVQQVLIMEQ